LTEETELHEKFRGRGPVGLWEEISTEEGGSREGQKGRVRRRVFSRETDEGTEALACEITEKC